MSSESRKLRDSALWAQNGATLTNGVIFFIMGAENRKLRDSVFCAQNGKKGFSCHPCSIVWFSSANQCPLCGRPTEASLAMENHDMEKQQILGDLGVCPRLPPAGFPTEIRGRWPKATNKSSKT